MVSLILWLNMQKKFCRDYCSRVLLSAVLSTSILRSRYVLKQFVMASSSHKKSLTLSYSCLIVIIRFLALKLPKLAGV